MVPLLLAVLALVPLPGIRTPSKNISCFYVPGGNSLLCDIKQASYLEQVQNQCMARDGLDWHGFTLNATRRGDFVCSGGILYNSNKNYPTYKTLAYGKTWKFSVFTCTSRVTGLTCVSRTGHGLFISRQSWRGW
jgi:Family of unknown function (DUF6636)